MRINRGWLEWAVFGAVAAAMLVYAWNFSSEREVGGPAGDSAANQAAESAASVVDSGPVPSSPLTSPPSSRADGDPDAFPEPDSDPAAFEDLIRRDPQLAARIVGSVDDIDRWDQWLPAVMESWIARDPGEAAHWATGDLPAGDFRRESVDELFFAWGERQPAAAADWLGSQDAPDPTAVTSLTASWAADDPESARAWLETLADRAPVDALGSLALAWGGSDPAAAADWVELLEDPSERSAAAANLVSGWAERDPAAALRWAARAPGIPESLRDSMQLAALHQWADRDPSGAVRHLEQLSDKSARERATQVVSEAMAEAAPDQAIQLAESLTAQGTRTDTVVSIFSDWLESDPAAAKVRLLERSAVLPAGAEREALLDLLYQHDSSFKARALDRALDP